MLKVGMVLIFVSYAAFVLITMAQYGQHECPDETARRIGGSAVVLAGCQP